MLQHQEWLSWPLVITLMSAGVWLIWRGLAVKSRLLQPAALNLNPDNPEHLGGRDADLYALSAAVLLHPLVFLAGETGVGKTALIRSGLIPTLNNTASSSEWMPIYVNCYGNDWDKGLQIRLVALIWHHLPESTRQSLEIADLEALQNLLVNEQGTQGIFQHLHTKLASRMLIVFDQFDDYIAQHHQKFLHNGRWISANELVAHNEFWCGIRGAIENQTLHCLFVVQNRWSMALEAVRFIPPVQHTLGLVESDVIAKLLAKLVVTQPADSTLKIRTKTVIANPNIGWVALKNLLIQDLTTNNRILPIKAKLVFNGIAALPELSIAAYEAAGGSDGIETIAVRNTVILAAKTASVSKIQVQNALMLLVDESIPLITKGKATAQSNLFNAAKVDAKRGTLMLAILQQHGLIRLSSTVTDATVNDDREWLLYHDYLAHLISAMQRHTNRWQRLLQAKQRTFYAVTGIQVKWRALLTPGEQLRLLLETLQGQIAWKGHKHFGFLSAVRLIPYILMLSMAAMSTQLILHSYTNDKADQILQGLKNTDFSIETIDKDTLRQLWAIATATPQFKYAVFERSLVSYTSHPLLIKKINILIQVLFGLDPQFHARTKALQSIVASSYNKKIQATAYQVLLGVGIYNTAPQVFKDFAAPLAQRINSIIRAHSDNKLLAILGLAMGSLGENAPTNEILASTRRLIDALRTSTDSIDIILLAKAINSFGKRLPLDHAALEANQLVDIMRNTTDRSVLVELGQALASISTQLPEQLETGIKRLVTVMGESTDREQIDHLASTVFDLAEKMPLLQRQSVALLLAKAMCNSSDIEQLNRIGNTLENLVNNIPKAEAVAITLAEGLKNSHDAQKRQLLSQFFSRLLDILTVSQLQTVVIHLAQLMNDTQMPDQLADLGLVFGKVLSIPKMANNPVIVPQIQIAAEQLLTAMSSLTIPRHLAELGQALATFGTSLSATHSEKGTARLVEAMNISTAPRQLSILALTLSNFGQRLPETAAQAGAMRLTEIIETGTDIEHLLSLGTALDALGVRLSHPQIVIARLFGVLSQNTDRDRITKIAQALTPLIKHLARAESQPIVEQITASMALTTDQYNLATQGQILAALLHLQAASMMPRVYENTKTSVELIANTMRDCSDWEQLIALGNALKDLAHINLNNNANDQALSALEKTATIGIDRLIEVMQASILPEQLIALGKVLGLFDTKLSAIQAQIAATRLTVAMRTSTAPLQLATLADVLKTISTHLTAPQIQILAGQLIDAMNNSSDTNQVMQFGSVLNFFADRISAQQTEAGAERLVGIMRPSATNQQLIYIATILGKLKHILPPTLLLTGAERLVQAMGDSHQGAQLAELGDVLGGLLRPEDIPDNRTTNAIIIPQIQAGAERIIDFLLTTTETAQIEQLYNTLKNLCKLLSLNETKLIAKRLVDAMQISKDWHQIAALKAAFRNCAEHLPKIQIQEWAGYLITNMQHTTSPMTFEYTARLLDAFPVTTNVYEIPKALELLKGPLAIGETRSHILAFIGRLAGTQFTSTDNLIAWCNTNLTLNLFKPAVSPF